MTTVTSEASRTTMTEIVLPTHANALGNVFGGQILAWTDICAAITAQRHCGLVAVTAGVDDLSFEKPIKVGEVVNLEARVTAVFRSSFEVRVIVRGENPLTRETWLCVEAYMTFVAIDANGKPSTVPPLAVVTDEDQELHRNAEQRRQRRLSRRKAT